MSDDLASRADDYERRLHDAGSTEAIVGGLVASEARNRRAVRLLAISLVVDVVLSVGMAVLALIAWGNAERIEDTTDRLTAVVYQQCLADQRAALSITAVLDTLVDATVANTLLSPAAKASRVQGYESVKPQVQDCVR